jgi:hypothetical protein
MLYVVVIESEHPTVYNSLENQATADEWYRRICESVLAEKDVKVPDGYRLHPTNCMMFHVAGVEKRYEGMVKSIILDGKGHKVMDCNETQKRDAWITMMGSDPPSEFFDPIKKTRLPKKD